ncbi:MAG: hypothetical protein M1823_000124 [Watsoniomyces obsoletus]|nr:MAG: hypothetical protein M1823_000124 [Watsoniomyces obsoletus]
MEGSSALEEDLSNWASGQPDDPAERLAAELQEHITKEDSLDSTSDASSPGTISGSSSPWLLRDFSDVIEGPDQRPSERPNKYHGDPGLWRQWNAEEIAIHKSILAQRNADLSLHLHRAHVLKKRFQDPERATNAPPRTSNQPGLRASDGSGAKQTRSPRFYPPKRWTAWPLPADIVPREGEKIGPHKNDADDHWTFKREETFRPSRVLEEILTGEILKKASGRFESREWEPQVKKRPEEPPLDQEIEELDQHMKQGGGNDEHGQSAKQEQGNEELRQKTSSGYPDYGKPVIMADDEEAAQLLRPTVRHILSKFDELLTGLHHTREACLISEKDKARTRRQTKSKSTSMPSSENEGVTAAITTKKMDTSNPSNEQPVKATEYTDPVKKRKSESDGPSTKKKSKMGRPKKYGQPLPGESYWQMRRRIVKAEKTARLVAENSIEANQPCTTSGHSNEESGKASEEYNVKSGSEEVAIDKQTGKNSSTQYEQTESGTRMYHCPHPTCHQDPSVQSSFNKAYNLQRHIRNIHGGKTEAQESEKTQAKQEPSDSVPHITLEQLRRSRRQGLRDWSDILHIASVTGWDENVIARTADRCSRLFGEGISIRTLHEEDARYPRPRTVEEEADVVEYRPDYVASPEEPEPQNGHGGLRHQNNVAGAGPPSHTQTMEDTEGDVDNDTEEEEMEGGVHVDGFLKPIPRPRHRTGKKRSGRKKKKVDEPEHGDATADTAPGVESGDDVMDWEEQTGEKRGGTTGGKKVVQRSLYSWLKP